MTPETRPLDSQLLRKLLLGELPSSEVESLAVEFASDDRLAEMAESLVEGDDTLRALLGNNETAVDSAAEPLVERLLQRLQLGRLTRTSDPTIALSSGGDATEAGFAREVRVAPKLPERLEYFRPLRILGQGGMGTVYLAEDTRLGREVAVKTLRAEFAANPLAKERFLREARTAARLEHDNVVPIYYVGEADGTPFLAMPLLKGESLDALLKRTNGPLTVTLAVRIAREIASGLAAAHALGLIHRDIKPANIWLESTSKQAASASEPKALASEPRALATGGFRAKLLDFGLAKAAGPEGESESSSPLTACGMIVGTPGYMAPEQAGGDAVDARADLFSLGCVLYQMLTGKVPFSGSNPLALIRSLAMDTPAAPETHNAMCSVALSRLVMRLLEKEPADRPESAEAVIAALDKLASQVAEAVPAVAKVATPETAAPRESLAGRPETNVPAPRSAMRRRMPVLVAVGLLALSVVYILFGGQIIRFATNQGELVVEVDDPAVEVKIVKDGVVIEDKANQRVFTLTAGKGEIEVREKDGVKLTTKKFELTRGGKSTVKVTLQELADARQKKPAVAQPGPVTPKIVPSPFDALRREDIPAYELAMAGGGDPALAPPELVAVLGDSRMRHWQLVTSTLFTPDGQSLLTSSYDQTARVWDIATGRQKQLLQTNEPEGRPIWLALSRDGKTLASMTADGMRIWDFPALTERRD